MRGHHGHHGHHGGHHHGHHHMPLPHHFHHHHRRPIGCGCLPFILSVVGIVTALVLWLV